MSIFRFTFGNGQGPDFIVDVTTTGTGDNLVMSSTPATNIQCRNTGLSLLSSFTPGNNNSPSASNTVGLAYWEFQEYAVPPAQNPKYWGWRSANTVLSHPTSGKSLDIWFAADNLNTVVRDGSTWNTFIAGGAAKTLNPNYWTVFYDYDGQYAVGWKKGGEVTVQLL
jgi:hypothetical protein